MLALRNRIQGFIELSNSGRVRHEVAVNLAVNYFNLIILFATLALTLGVPFVFKNKLGSTLIIGLLLAAALGLRQVAKTGRPDLSLNRFAIVLWLLSAGHLYASQEIGAGGLMVCSFLAVYGAVSGFARALLYASAYLLFAIAFFVAIHFGLEAKIYFPGGPAPSIVVLLLTLPVALLPLPPLFRQLNEALTRSEKEIAERRAAELALQQSTERFSDFSSSVSDWFWETDAEHRFTFLSRPSRDQATGSLYKNIGLKPWENATPTEGGLNALWQTYQNRLDAHQAFRDFEYPIKTRKGETRWMSTSGKPLFSSTGEFLGYRGVGIDITEHMRVEISMVEAREAAESANRTKSQFLDNLSHEVRTPLNGILGMTSLLEMGELNEEQTLILNQLKESTQALQAMLNRILNFSNLEAGAVKKRHEPFTLSETCIIPIDSHRAAAKNKGLVISFEIDDALPSIVVGDPAQLLQILDNLVDNAVKFTDRGQVTLAVTLADEPALRHQIRICFSVRDTGCGISQEQHATLFEIFSQGDGSYTRRAGGNGIGLAICRSIIKLLDGKISFDSTPGEGSLFKVTLSFDTMAE